jgi:hypothetical protein
MTLRWIVLWWLGILGAAHATDMTVLRYVDQDPGGAPYQTRILVTPDFMRMDTGEDDGDFFLLDRRHKKVFNIMRERALAMVFVPGALPPRPADWRPRLDVQPAAPGTRRFRLSMNGVVCSEGVAARSAAPDAARAMAEMKAVLASMQYRVWKESPQALQHDCDLANLVWESGTTLTLGLPLEEREFTGRSRLFESETRQPLRPGLFRLPTGVAEINAPS